MINNYLFSYHIASTQCLSVPVKLLVIYQNMFSPDMQVVKYLTKGILFHRLSLNDTTALFAK